MTKTRQFSLHQHVAYANRNYPSTAFCPKLFVEGKFKILNMFMDISSVNFTPLQS